MPIRVSRQGVMVPLFVSLALHGAAGVWVKVRAPNVESRSIPQTDVWSGRGIEIEPAPVEVPAAALPVRGSGGGGRALAGLRRALRVPPARARVRRGLCAAGGDNRAACARAQSSGEAGGERDTSTSPRAESFGSRVTLGRGALVHECSVCRRAEQRRPVRRGVRQRRAAAGRSLSPTSPTRARYPREAGALLAFEARRRERCATLA